jgi:hypothetical protein
MNKIKEIYLNYKILIKLIKYLSLLRDSERIEITKMLDNKDFNIILKEIRDCINLIKEDNYKYKDLVLESIKQYIYSELIYKKYYKGIYNESN